MKTTSWHYKLVKIFNPTIHYEDIDFCTYWQKIVIALVIVLSISFGALASTSALIYFIINNIRDFLVGIGVVLSVGAIFIAALLVIAGASSSKDYILNKTIVGIKYKSWKEQYCPNIKFVQPDKK